MSNLDETKSRDELVAELDLANASYDGAKAKELEAAIKKLDEQGVIHKKEMTETTDKANQEKTMKMEELTNLLKDKPENAETNAESIKEQTKGRLGQTIDRFTNKIKEIKSANEGEKEKLNNELKTIKEELKKTKEEYEIAKNSFYGPTKYNFEKFTPEDLKKASTRTIRYATRENKLFNSPRLTKMKTIRRNITIKTLIKKFNKMGDNPTKGVRFVLGFEKARFLRYAGVKVTTGLDQAASAMGMKMPAKEFHAFFNAGKKNIFTILDADTGDEKTEGEKKVIEAIKNRINYYGEAYDRQRASERINESTEAKKETKNIKMNIPNNDALAA